MSSFQKLKERFLSKPSDFTYAELKRLLNGLGYKEAKTGKTSGSRVAFINGETKHIIRLHKPHRSNALKHYQLGGVEESLRQEGLL